MGNTFKDGNPCLCALLVWSWHASCASTLTESGWKMQHLLGKADLTWSSSLWFAATFEGIDASCFSFFRKPSLDSSWPSTSSSFLLRPPSSFSSDFWSILSSASFVFLWHEWSSRFSFICSCGGVGLARIIVVLSSLAFSL